VRVVCATNRELADMVAADQFREDLWFRINTFEIALPPLRQRIDDVATLARHLAVRFGAKVRPGDEVFAPETLDALREHTWPGNVRELANVIEHALILRDAGPIVPEHLPRRFTSPRPTTPTLKLSRPCSLREIEVQAIHAALDRHQGNKPQAAEELGISLKTLYNKLSQASALSRSA
jgi:two-component system NtrC family response regulator